MGLGKIFAAVAAGAVAVVAAVAHAAIRASAAAVAGGLGHAHTLLLQAHHIFFRTVLRQV